MLAQDPADREGVVTALRRCADLAGRARDAEAGALAALVEALDPLHPLMAGGRPGAGASPVSSAWDAVGDHVVTMATAGLPAAHRRETADDLAALLGDLADRLGAA